MSALDWTIVATLNGAVIVWTLLKSRQTETSADWFLAGRSLPWWVVGLSLYATAIDSTDLVVDGGAAYGLGLGYFVVNWVGVVGGWFILAHFIAPAMYRAGMYTNAEYLEARFGPAARVISVFVQVLYRSMIIGMIGTTNYLTLTIVCGWEPATAWTAVGLIALVATVYTTAGGLKSVAFTDALQSVVMIAGSIALFVVVWNEVGGWAEVERRIAAENPALAERILHVGRESVSVESTAKMNAAEIDAALRIGGTYDAAKSEITHTTPGWLLTLHLIIAGLAYAIVNHTQSMRLLGARSLRDLKLAIVPAGIIMLVLSFLNLSMGILGKALWPDLETLPVPDGVANTVDAVFPILVREYTSAGLKGIVVAGIFAAAFSTYDSIGSAISTLVTRDLYARVLVKDRDDAHYLSVCRWLTPIVIFGSFLYVPALLSKGMIFVGLDIIGSFVVPLLAVYLVGAFTRAHRSAGTIGLLAGVTYGLVAMFAPDVAREYDVRLLPLALLDSNATGAVAFGVTAGAMLLVTLVRGAVPRGELIHEEKTPWLRETRARLGVPERETGSDRLSFVLGLLVVAAGLVLSFVVFG